MTTCNHCSGNHGQFVNGSHVLCAVLAARDLPTPCLGITCTLCKGRGWTKIPGTTQQPTAVYTHPGELAAAMNVIFPPCPACNGKGYTSISIPTNA